MPIAMGVVAGLLLAAAPSVAQVAQDQTLTVQARIGELCTVTSAALDFGPGIDIDVDNDAQGSIAIDCASPTTLGVQLSGGLAPGFSGERNMSDGASQLKYFLFKDSARSQFWATGDQVSTTVTGTGSVPVYGRVPIQTNGHAPGVYTDEVTITLVF
jgi:spore coat protein U-like protein